ncbi:MAG: TonB-dependent receptor [Proteiniphilum sp.]|nr:TonB-dependent receptor [Proteiniphilum sp.]MDD4458888.1 TonB-dependent receptor [Proteiniphilum sp.]
MKKIVLSLLTIFGGTLTLMAQAQSGSTLSGKLIDKETNEPVALANVRLLRQSDSSFVAGKASDAKGLFTIPVERGDYIVQVSYIGYHNEYRNVEVTPGQVSLQLDDITLTSDNILLSEAVVTAKAAEIAVRGDTLEYNADSYKVTESAVVEDLLKKMPGVEIDSEGKITVNGKEIKKILVDGEEFFSDDPKVASKNLPARMVDKLQVLERRTEQAQMTGFDDGEEENVINLTVRPGMKEGLFGNAFAGYGSQDRYEGNAMVNYMKEKDQYTFLGGINNTNNAGFTDLSSAMFGNLGGGMRRGGWGGNSGISTSGNLGGNFSKQFRPELKLGGNIRYGFTDTNVNSDVFTQQILSAGNTLEDERNRSNNKSENFAMDLRLEWEPDSATRIIFRPALSLYANQRQEEGNFYTENELSGDTINQGDSEYFSDGDGRDLSFNLDVSRELGKEGRILSLQLRGQRGNSQNDGNSLSGTFYNGTRPDDLIDQRFTNINRNRSWRGYLSYVEPLGDNHYLQLAYQYRQNISASDRDTRTRDDAGNYTRLDTLYSKRLENNFVGQEIEANFKGVRETYDYMFGFSMQPSSSRSKTFVGNELKYDGEQKVINYAPMAQLNYRWSRTHNLRLRYAGTTEQPSLTQLSPVMDVTNPLNISYGNPDLKPSFEHRLNIRYQRSNPEKASSFNTFINAGYMTNDIVTASITNVTSGRRETTYRNVGGNWNVNGRMMFNLPLGNIRFSLFSMSFASYSNTSGFSKSITDENESLVFTNADKNTNKRMSLAEVMGLNYRSDQFDFAVRGNVNYNNVTNSLEGQQNQNYFNYGANANGTFYLPWDLTLESDINYSSNSGYADGFEQNEWLWNASLQKTIFKQKSGTIRFKLYDILQQRSNISRSVTSNYIRDTTTNTLTSYFMVHFVYRFNFFKGGATQQDMMPQRAFDRGKGYGGRHRER